MFVIIVKKCNFHNEHQQENDITYLHFSFIACATDIINKRIEIILCVVSKDIILHFSSLLNIQPTDNSSFLFDDNYGYFPCVHQQENDVNFCYLLIFDSDTDDRITQKEILLCVVSKDIISIFLSS